MYPKLTRLPLLALALSVVACKSAEEHRADADEDVYGILDVVRSRLADDFLRIERPADTLRARLLSDTYGEEDPLPPLFLAEVLEIAAENSREYQTRRERLYLEALDLTLSQWDFSVQEVGQLGAFLTDSGAVSSFSGVGETSAGADGALVLTKLFETGATALGSIGFDFGRDVSRGDAWGVFTNLSFNITQPILRGYGRDIVREPLTQAERNVLYEARSFERFRRTFAFDTASRFFRVLGQVETIRNEELNYQNLKQLRERNEAFAQAGLLSDIQVDQAKQNELTAENRLVLARRTLEDSLDDLKLFLGLPVETDLSLDQAELEALDRFESEIASMPEEEAVSIALRERLDHLTILDGVVDAERRVKVFADALRTGMDISLDAGTSSQKDQPFDFDLERTSWTAGIDLDLPLNRLPERNAYVQRQIELQVALRDVEESIDRVRSELRDAIRQLLASRQTYEIQTGAVVLAERRVESATLNLEAGRASTRDLLEAQEDLVSAQNAAIRAGIDKLLAELAFYRDLELLRVGPEGLSIDGSRINDSSDEITP